MKPLLLLLMLSLSSMALAVEPLHSGDYRQHVDARPRPLLVILWSVDCPPCHDELAALGTLQNDFPNMPVTYPAFLRSRGMVSVSAGIGACPSGLTSRFPRTRAWPV